ASIWGPGLTPPLSVSGDGEGPGTALGTLAMSSGFFAQMFGQTPDPTFTKRPKRALGPRYKVVYVVPGGNDIESRVVQWIFPYAKPATLTYMRANQPFWHTERAHRRWRPTTE